MVYQLCRASGARALVIDYRMAPEHPYPAAVDDCLAAYKWLLEQKIKPAHVVFAGDSAGGGLTMATMLAARQDGLKLPAAAVCISPWVDLKNESPSRKSLASKDPMLTPSGVRHWAESYLNGAEPVNPLASPLYADLAGLPTLLIHVGSNEILLDDSIRLHSKAEKAKVKSTLKVWPDMMHVFQVLYNVIEQAKLSIDEMGKFIAENIKVK